MEKRSSFRKLGSCLMACSLMLIFSNLYPMKKFKTKLKKLMSKKNRGISVKTSERDQFMISFNERKKSIEKYKKAIKKVKKEIAVFVENIGKKRYAVVLENIKDSWKCMYALREDVKLDYIMLMLPKYSKKSKRNDLLRALCKLYTIEAFILKFEIVPMPVGAFNYCIGGQIELYVDKGEDITNKALKNEIDLNMKKSNRDLLIVICKKEKMILESLKYLKIKEKLCNEYNKLRKILHILKKVKDNNRDIEWIENYFEKESDKKIIINRKGEVKFLERKVKKCTEKMQKLKSKFMPKIYDQIIKKTKEGYPFIPIFVTGKSLKSVVTKLEKKCKVTFDEKSPKKELLKAYENIMVLYLGILMQEKFNKNLVFKPPVEAKKIRNNLSDWVDYHKENSSKKKLYNLVAFSHKKIKSDYKDLEKKEKLYNEYNQLKSVVISLKKHALEKTT
ncbi:hypothetical protein ACFLYU_03480 [Candidatus Dependentiae bacterium]